MIGSPPRGGLALVGPTASGKSALAITVARVLGDIEIVTVDSMAVYRGMDIGTAKPSIAEREGVPHHLLDVVDPSEDYTLRRFQQDALAAIDDITSRGRRPLLVGGTGLYLRAVVDELEIPGRYPQVRAELEAEADTPRLFERLGGLDPVAAGRMEPGNRRRIIRALEVCEGSGRPFSSYGAGLDQHGVTGWDIVGLRVEPAVLAERINQRYEQQLADGFLDEVRALSVDPIGRTASQALGYRQLLDHLRGACTLDEAVEAAETATRRFARRQRSWFGRDPRITWLEASAPEDRAVVMQTLVDRWEDRAEEVAGEHGTMEL